jgi:PTS system mannose-specific IIA component
LINFIIVTHGEFGAYLIEAAESIVGRQASGVRAVAISSRLSIPEIRRRLERVLKEMATEDGVVVFTDMPGGTPSNISFPLIQKVGGVALVSGVNLYMLVSAFGQRQHMRLELLVEKIIADGRRSIADLRQMVVSRTR